MNTFTLTPLGTVSPYCKKEHNCPGFLVTFGRQKILLDCGNGITRLLNFPQVLDDLHVIITHYHKDHYGDLGALQYASFVYHALGMLENKISVYLPDEDVFGTAAGITSTRESYANYYEIQAQKCLQLGELRITFEDNRSHAVPSLMVKLKAGEKQIVYTSDVGTTNFAGLVRFAKHADLLVCESSFLKQHASAATTHLRACDAAEAAKQAQVGQLLLTHFWPEEERELYLAEAKQVFENSRLAQEGEILKI